MTQELKKTHKQRPQNRTLFEKAILTIFARLSVGIAILGRRGTGKTDLSLYIAEIVAKFKIIDHIATNIKIYASAFDIEFIDNLEDLKYWCKETKGRKLFILDEIGRSIKKRRPMAELNIQFINELQILRKYKLSLIIIAPSDIYIDNATLGSDVLDGVFVKYNPFDPKVAYYKDFLVYNTVEWSNIPRTNVKFDTWDSAQFKKDSPNKRPHFQDKELNNLYEWSEGAKIKELGWSRSTFHRVLRRYVKETLKTNVQRTT